jgi:hypothetical protein
MKKVLLTLCALIILIISACKKEKMLVIVNNETPIPECLKEGLPDLEIPQYKTKEIWKLGGACGSKDGIEWKSFVSASFNSSKDKFNLSFKKYDAIPVYIQTSSFENIPLKKGIYNIAKVNYDAKDKDLICSTFGFFYRHDDVILENLLLDPRQVNTLEVIKWDEQTNEIYGVYHVNFLTAAAVDSGQYNNGVPLAFRNCYFKAIVK